MPRLLRGMARTAAIAGTATAVSNRVSRRQAGRWAQQEQAQAYQQQQAAAPPPPPAPAPAAAPASGGSMEDKLALLQQLGQLKEQGVLTEAEFQEQKTRILST
ncbi:SHOCT domain-containing protein [Kribbella sp. CA-253562]|uniref:SHOCT domain-containing protein n=1 Tax=Kribbella sp. CA-253562 TaxID=3239942 RepID=UPI003D8E10DB